MIRGRLGQACVARSGRRPLGHPTTSTMTSVSAIATSGMRAADTAMRTSAHNLANLETAGFRRERLVNTAQAAGGVEASTARSQVEGPSDEEDLVAQLQAKNAFLANLAVFRSGSRATGRLLDVLA